LEDPERPIVWICHSLGGIVVKQALISAAGQSKHQRHNDLGGIYDATIDVLFLGTPHRGSSKEELGRLFAFIAQAAAHKVNTQLLATVAENSHILQQQRDDVTTISNNLDIFCFYETMRTAGIAGTQLLTAPLR
jgi:hypothetical protein